MSTYIFDTMKLKVLFLLNCESPEYIAKLFSLSILYVLFVYYIVDYCYFSLLMLAVACEINTVITIFHYASHDM